MAVSEEASFTKAAARLHVALLVSGFALLAAAALAALLFSQVPSKEMGRT